MSSHYCTDTFRKVNTVHNRITRTSVNNIYVITPKIGSVEYSVIYKCPLFFNSLPNYIKNSQSVREFKGKLKLYLHQDQNHVV